MTSWIRVQLLLIVLFSSLLSTAQDAGSLVVRIVDENGIPLHNSTVEILRSEDSALVKVQPTDTAGVAYFEMLSPGNYLCKATMVGRNAAITEKIILAGGASLRLPDLTLTPYEGTMSQVVVRASKPFIEMKPGKVVVNVESSPGMVGATVMEALEKMPGITVNRDGGILLKGKSGVTIMIDGKPTYLDPSQLATLLNGMSASQISQVEIMDNPSARFDAAGNAGIINIKTKKSTQKGFNGSAMGAYVQGKYPKYTGNLQLNYRTGKWNFTANYNANVSEHFTRIYALRTYYADDDKTVLSYLEQPSIIRTSGYTHVAKAGVDHFISNRSTIGLTINGLLLERSSRVGNPAEWQSPGGSIDSLVFTYSRSSNDWKNLGANLNFRHTIKADQEFSADVDLIGYRTRGDQFFENTLLTPPLDTQTTKALLPGDINIFSAKADYVAKHGAYKIETGAKSTRTETDNDADYKYLEGQTWKQDYGKTNHFIYKEYIHAIYGSAEREFKKLTLQAGLRYEMTRFNANQMGNAQVKDSSFSRSYNSLFPTLFASWEADSNHSFSFSAGRRIDRPPFQKLNPFLFIINKYTYEKGNPFYRPQYTWNTEVSHAYRNRLITSLSYSYTKDYFSQVFPIDSNGIVLYSVGNMGSMKNFGVSVSVVHAPARWWSLNLQTVLNHKIMSGYIDRQYREKITQVTVNMNNQFRFGKGWTGEVTGFYVSKSQHDIQEVVDPSGQLSLAVSKTVLKGSGTVRVGARDIFYTQWMKGFTTFTHATEYFKVTRDTRVVGISFSYRFGKAFKMVKRSQGAAGDEVERISVGG